MKKQMKKKQIAAAFALLLSLGVQAQANFNVTVSNH